MRKIEREREREIKRETEREHNPRRIKRNVLIIRY